MRADTLDNIVGRSHGEARRDGHLRDGRRVEAIRALTTLAEKVDMQVVVGFMAVAVAEFIAQGTAAVLDGMHQMVLAKKGQSPEHTRLINRQNLVFQFGERHRPPSLSQRADHHDAVGRRLHPMLLQQLNAFLLLHVGKITQNIPNGQSYSEEISAEGSS